MLNNIDVMTVNGDLEVDVKGISYDSRSVSGGDLFVAIPGFKEDGAKFIPQAVKSGASAVITKSPAEGISVPQVVVDDPRAALALASCAFYGNPSRGMKVVGVTGTNGKTTVCYLLDHILRAAHRRTGLITTVETRQDGKSVDSKLTTPESLNLQKILRGMKEDGVTHVVMEVSSHSLALNRVLGTEFDVAVFTNLTHDHLDFHGTMDEYFKAKLKLFESLMSGAKKQSLAVVNRDDPRSKALLDLLKARALTYGINLNANLTAKNVSFGLHGTGFNIATEKGSIGVRSKLIGMPNVYNTLAALLSSMALGEDLGSSISSLESFNGAPGRYESVDCGQPFPVIVDFAHSPDSLRKLIEAYRPLVKGRVILVFGCPGDRDREKRPMMGEIAAKLADHVIISTDDPHSEEPGKIVDEIEKGVRLQALGPRGYEKIVDRKQAIEKALSLAKADDIVLIAGRGHEKHQDFNGKRVEIDDRAVARDFLSK